MKSATALSRELGFHLSWLPRVVKENRHELLSLGLVKEEWKGRKRRWWIVDEEGFIDWLKQKGYYLPEARSLDG